MYIYIYVNIYIHIYKYIYIYILYIIYVDLWQQHEIGIEIVIYTSVQDISLQVANVTRPNKSFSIVQGSENNKFD